jgi:hypothetical protein
MISSVQGVALLKVVGASSNYQSQPKGNKTDERKVQIKTSAQTCNPGK